jgi:mono/diheme cytochrome c family protein
MPRPILLALAIALSLSARSALAQQDEAEAFFESNVRPLLVAHCAKCHGADKQSSGLRVDSRAALITGGERGPAIIPGDPERSLLVTAVRHGDDLTMPPDERLPERNVADLVAWIRAGAVWPARAAPADAFAAARHWAFQLVAQVAPPEDPSGWALTPIDRFVMAGLRDAGLHPAPPASKQVLLRRAYFDLIGLPPKPDELAQFLADDSPDAFARVVDRLLASPRYGERWGRHWMDVVRYADTAGDNADYPVPEVHLYRDYIIAAFNNDKPYDQFVREQLAGDILATAAPIDRYAEQVIATGFVALTRRYGTMPKELWHLTIEDTIDTLGQAFLGLSLRCARCHDHKFDPVTSEDYYALYGIFDSTRYPYAGSEEYQSKELNRTGFVPLVPTAVVGPSFEAHAQHVAELRAVVEQAEQNEPLTKKLGEIKTRLEAIAKQLSESPGDNPSAPDVQQEQARLEKEKKDIKRELDAKLKTARADLRDAQRSGLPPDVPGAYAVSEGEPHDVPLQHHGEPGEPGPVVRRNAPRFLRGEEDLTIPAGASGREQLANWLVRSQNPLVARVMVNRIWQQHFGKGIVATPSNFGTRGAAPTHPGLLDWLAQEFVADGWSIKSMHRALMSSRTYQMSSTGEQAALSVDPENRLYWRHDRRRLDAESLRDALLSIADTLELDPPAAHPFPPLNDWHWTQHSPFKTIFPSNKRSVYLMTQRLQRHPYLVLFDGPDTNYSTGARTEVTVPLQALFFLNNPLLADQARGFAARMLAANSDPAARVQAATLSAWARPAEADETARALAYLDAVRQELINTGCASDELELASWTSYARVLLSANEFLYVD